MTRFTSAGKLISTLKQGNLQWLLIGIFVHMVYFGIYAVLYLVCFLTVGVKTNYFNLVPVMFASIFINSVAPTGGVGGAAVFIDHTSKKGQSGGRTAIGLILLTLADLGTLIPFLIFGLAYLQNRRDLKSYEIITASFFVVFLILLTAMILLSARRPKFLQKILEWIRRLIDRIGAIFKKPDLISEDWPERNTNEFRQAALAIAKNPKYLEMALLIGFVLHIINVAGLYAFFLAFKQPISLGGLMAGFGLGIVFFVVTVVPQGVGAVEGIMALVFTSLGIPSAQAITIALVFRGVNFWLPLLVGLLVIGRVTSAKKEAI